MKRNAITIILSTFIINFIFAQQEPQIFIVGSDEGNAVYWLNNEKFVLPKVGANASANAIAVSGTDVYIAGSEYANNSSGIAINRDAVYWLNGRRFVLPKVGANASANAIAVSGTNVYIAGSDGNDAVYWLNGRRNVLPKTNNRATASANAITIYDSNIYIVGNIYVNYGRDAAYWLNGRQIILSKANTEYKFSEWYLESDFFASSIFISGSNIYFAGGLWEHNTGHALYWLNERWFWLSSENFISSANGIVVSGSDVYIVGTVNDHIGPEWYDFNSNAVYWLNNRQYMLSNSGNSNARAIFIRQ